MTGHAAEREQAILDMMQRTGKTREQVEAFLTMVGSAMGWKRVDDDEYRAAFRTFVDTDKYGFVFEAWCTVAYPDDPVAHEVTALLEPQNEDASDIYRFQVQNPMTWDEIAYAGAPVLWIRDGDTELIRVDGDD